MRIITNTAALLAPEEGRARGIQIVPVSVSVRNRSLRDYVDISADEFTTFLKDRTPPTTSQPSPGDVLELLEDSGEETILLTVADGLSGEYETAVGLANALPNKDRIHVINSGSLGGPLRYMALRAAQLRDQGRPAKEILAELRMMVRSSVSFLIPSDFSYLKRSGRITNLTSKIGGALKLLPVLTQTEDRKRILPIAVRRTWKSAVGLIVSRLKELGVGEQYLLTVEYADRKDTAEQVIGQLREEFPKTECELLQLAPSLITHGGPGCVVVQAVKKASGE